MNEQQIKELRAHAGKLVAEGKPLSGVFEYSNDLNGIWLYWEHDAIVPNFERDYWRIAQPKKQLIDWSHPYFKGCATNYGACCLLSDERVFTDIEPWGHPLSALRLSTPANEHTNWQYFSSTPENDLKLRELAKMVKVQVRWFCVDSGCYKAETLAMVEWFKLHNLSFVCNYRITGLQDGWTFDPKEAV